MEERAEILCHPIKKPSDNFLKILDVTWTPLTGEQKKANLGTINIINKNKVEFDRVNFVRKDVWFELRMVKRMINYYGTTTEQERKEARAMVDENIEREEENRKRQTLAYTVPENIDDLKAIMNMLSTQEDGNVEATDDENNNKLKRLTNTPDGGSSTDDSADEAESGNFFV